MFVYYKKKILIAIFNIKIKHKKNKIQVLQITNKRKEERRIHYNYWKIFILYLVHFKKVMSFLLIKENKQNIYFIYSAF